MPVSSDLLMRHLYNGNSLVDSFLLDTISGAKYLHLLSQFGIFARISLQQIGQIGTSRSAGQIRLPSFPRQTRQRVLVLRLCFLRLEESALRIYNNPFN